MKKYLLVALFLVPNFSLAESPKASLKMSKEAPAAPTSPELISTYADIRATLGLVPTFLRSFPEVALPAAWQEFKSVQLNPHSAIPPKYKELLGLAVASQIPCHYCTYFHTEAAKANGASIEQLTETVALSALERHWSAFFSGSQVDYGDFKQEVKKIFRHLRDNQESANKKEAPPFNLKFATAKQAQADIEDTFGFFPEFMKGFPESGLAGAWGEIKAISFNPNTSIPLKYKDLISLAVSAQIPCPYCVYFDTEAAKFDGATDEEISEAITLASISRHWSTVLNGAQTDMATFQREMDQVFHPKSEKKNTPQNRAQAHPSKKVKRQT